MTSTIQNGEGVEARAREVLADRVRRLAPHKAAAIMAGASDDHVRVCTTIAAMIAFADESRHSLAREPATADVERERQAFETWWRMWCPDRDMPSSTSHIFDAWIARARAAPSSEPAFAEGERLRLFLEILLASGGTASASDSKWDWVNAFCEEHEGRSPDTFNSAIDRGFATSCYDGDRDYGTVTITDAGRAFLAQSSTPPASKGVEADACEPERLPRDLAVAFCTKLRQSEKAGAARRIGVLRGLTGDTLETDKAFLRDVQAAGKVESLRLVVASMLPEDALSTPSNDTLQGRGEVKS